MEHTSTESMLIMLIHCVEVSTEKTKYMVVSHHQYVRQNHILLIANKCSENVAVQVLGNNSNKSKLHS
jgi:hypothetical protein